MGDYGGVVYSFDHFAISQKNREEAEKIYLGMGLELLNEFSKEIDGSISVMNG